jgi:hypothetical protein
VTLTALITLCTGRTSSVASTVAPTKPKSRHSSSKSSSAFRLFGNVSGSSTLITPDMITYYKELSISKDLVDRLKHASVRAPQLLLGWQLVVVLEAGTNAGTACVVWIWFHIRCMRVAVMELNLSCAIAVACSGMCMFSNCATALMTRRSSSLLLPSQGCMW